MKVLFVGDMHGNSRFAVAMVERAASVGAVIVQVGDFGYWPHTATGKRFLVEVEAVAAANDVELFWIDGNHENYTQLRAMRASDDGTVAISDQIRYLPRGYRWEWDGVRFGALGGAFSVDWRGRQPEESWWPDDEEPSDTDVDCLGGDRLDVLVTHDAPAGIHLAGWELPDGDQTRCDRVRARVRRAVEVTEPSLLVHGHWHIRHTTTLTWTAPERTPTGANVPWRQTRVEGLAHDMKPAEAFWLLDLAEFRAAPTTSTTTKTMSVSSKKEGDVDVV